MSALHQLGRIRIDEAIADGSLAPPAAGTRLDLDAYFRTPAAWRSGFALLRGQGFRPPELDLLKQAHELEQTLPELPPEKQAATRRRIEELRVQFRLASENRPT